MHIGLKTSLQGFVFGTCQQKCEKNSIRYEIRKISVWLACNIDTTDPWNFFAVLDFYDLVNTN